MNQGEAAALVAARAWPQTCMGLLLAGALHVDLSQLKALRWPVASLALVGTTVSARWPGTCTSILVQGLTIGRVVRGS